jgi:ankyrin repeat protein
VNRFLIAISCLAATLLPFPAIAQKDSLASLIQSGNRRAALEKIRSGADVNEAQPDGTRPIHWAIYHVDYELIDALVAKHVQVNVTNQFGSTPIAEAAGLGDARIVKALLAAGAEPEGADEDGQTALMVAIKTGELPVVEMLIKAGANVNAVEKFHNQTPLMWAATAPRNAGAMVRLLLSKDASVQPRSLYSDWPSQITSEPRAQYRPTGGLTALLYAARDGCYDCVEALLGAGANPNVPTPEGVTAVMLALDNDHNDVAKLLLDRGANPGVWDWWGRTALYIVVDRKEGGSSGGLRLGLRAIGGDGRGAGPTTHTGPEPAVSQMDIVNVLLAAGVDPDPQLNMHRPSRGGNSGRFIDPLLSTGCTPLLRATMGGDIEVVQALLSKGASPNINAMGLTPFLVAAGVGAGNRGGTGLAAQSSAGAAANTALMDLLLQNGASVNVQVTDTKTYSMRIARAPSANEGMTALHVAAQSGRTDLVRYLLGKGASTEITDAAGRKPIDLVGSGVRATATPAPPAGSGSSATSAAPRASEGTPPAAGARRDPGSKSPGANADEIRALLENAASGK